MMTTQQDEQEWETVSTQARVKIAFDTIGDEFRGFYQGSETITDPNPDEGDSGVWEQYNFIGFYPPEVDGELVAIAAGYDLRRALDQIPPGEYAVRIVRGRDVKVEGRPSPLKTFDVAKRRTAAPAM